MKHKVFILSILFMLMFSSFAFAGQIPSQYDHLEYRVRTTPLGDGSYSVFLSSSTIFYNLMGSDPYLQTSGTGRMFIFSSSGSLIANSAWTSSHIIGRTVETSTHDVPYAFDPDTIFFSLPRDLTMVEVATQDFLPNLLSQVGGITGVGLLIFGMMLVVLLVPQFLRRWVL